MKEVTIYTDGSALGNPGPSGWGYVIIYNDTPEENSGSMGNSTNNRAEITAAIQALNNLYVPCKVTLYSDSQYLVNTMNKKFQKSANKDLWVKLEEAAKQHSVTWKWVRAHNGDHYNEIANKLATGASRKSKVYL